mgnify:CR=1 FL=1
MTPAQVMNGQHRTGGWMLRLHLSPTVAHWSSAAIAVPAAAVSKRVAKNFMMTFWCDVGES